MNEEHVAAVAVVLARWLPLGDEARDVADLDGYRVEAADIIFALKTRGKSAKPERLVMTVLNQAFDLTLDAQGLRTRNAYANNLFIWTFHAIHGRSGAAKTGLRQSVAMPWEVTHRVSEREAVR